MRNNENRRLNQRIYPEANTKLDDQYNGTREAIRLIAQEKASDFILKGDVGLRLRKAAVNRYHCRKHDAKLFPGYGVGKVEGSTRKAVYL